MRGLRSRRKALASGLFVLVLVLLSFFVLQKPASPPLSGDVLVSDTVLSNTSFVKKSSKGVSFFTGSNVATVALEKVENRPSSSSLFAEAAFNGVDQVDYNTDAKVLVAKVSNDSLLGLDVATDDTTVWVIQRGKDKPVEFSIEDGVAIVDARVDTDAVYGLLYRGQNSSDVFRYDLKTGKSKLIAVMTGSTRVAGLTKDSVILQDYKGGVFQLPKQGDRLRQIGKRSIAYVDPESGGVLVADTGGVKKGDYTGTLLLNGKSRKLSLATKNVFVSNGFVVVTNSQLRPNEVTLINQTNGEAKRYSLSYINPRSSEALDSVLVLSANPLKIALVTSGGQTLLASTDAKQIEAIKPFRYPSISSVNGGGISIVDTPGTGSVAIYTKLSEVQQSLSSLRAACDCDVNQINKSWIPSIEAE